MQKLWHQNHLQIKLIGRLFCSAILRVLHSWRVDNLLNVVHVNCFLTNCFPNAYNIANESKQGIDFYFLIMSSIGGCKKYNMPGTFYP